MKSTLILTFFVVLSSTFGKAHKKHRLSHNRSHHKRDDSSDGIPPNMCYLCHNIGDTFYKRQDEQWIQVEMHSPPDMITKCMTQCSEGKLCLLMIPKSFQNAVLDDVNHQPTLDDIPIPYCGTQDEICPNQSTQNPGDCERIVITPDKVEETTAGSDATEAGATIEVTTPSSAGDPQTTMNFETTAKLTLNTVDTTSSQVIKEAKVACPQCNSGNGPKPAQCNENPDFKEPCPDEENCYIINDGAAKKIQCIKSDSLLEICNFNKGCSYEEYVEITSRSTTSTTSMPNTSRITSITSNTTDSVSDNAQVTTDGLTNNTSSTETNGSSNTDNKTEVGNPDSGSNKTRNDTEHDDDDDDGSGNGSSTILISLFIIVLSPLIATN